MAQAKKRSARIASNPYAVHPSVAMVQRWVASLKEKSGRSLDEWLVFVKKSGPKGDQERREWLQSAHGLGTNTAGWIAERSAGKGGGDDDPEAYLRAAVGYVDAMYSGKKAALRPLYESLLRFALRIGKDVKACPCKTIVPLYRTHVFAELKPSTQARIDLGLALGKTKVPKRLIATGGLEKGDRLTHRIPIARAEDFDEEAKEWLRRAYAMNA